MLDSDIGSLSLTFSQSELVSEHNLMLLLTYWDTANLYPEYKCRYNFQVRFQWNLFVYLSYDCIIQVIVGALK